MRVPFVIAFADGMAMQIIRSINAMDFYPGGTIRGRHFDSLSIAVSGRELHFLVHRLAQNVTLPDSSAAPSRKWDVALLLPCDTMETRIGPLLHRAKRRAILSGANRAPGGGYYLYGPWSIPRVAAAYPALAASHLTVLDADGQSTGILRTPIMFAGDPAPELVAKIDYSPSDADCVFDQDISEGELLADIYEP